MPYSLAMAFGFASPAGIPAATVAGKATGVGCAAGEERCIANTLRTTLSFPNPVPTQKNAKSDGNQ